MGLLDSLTGGGSSDDEEEEEDWSPGEDGWMIAFSDPDKGGWSPIDEFSNLDEPISRRQFEINTGTLDPGTYRIFATEARETGADLKRTAPDEVGWKLTVERDEPEPDDDEDDEIDQLERKLDRLRSELADDGDSMPQDPEMMLEQAQAQLAIQALNSEEFIKAYGDKIALSAFGGLNDGGMSVDFDTFEDNPVGATMYQAMENPEKMGDIGGALGKAAGEFAQGMSRTFDVSDALSPGSDDSQEAGEVESETDDGEAPPEPAEVSDPGPSSFGDLDVPDADPEETAEEVAEARVSAQESEPDESDTMPPEPGTADGEAEPADSGAEADAPDGDEYAPDEPVSSAPVDGADEQDPYDSLDPDDPPSEGVDGTTGEMDGGTLPDGRPRCQATTSQGEQCGNPAQDGSRYCHVESHGPTDPGDGQEDTGSADVTADDSPTNTTATGSSDPEAIAEDL